MILNNFLFRVRRYAWENRARLIKCLLIAAVAILALALIHYSVQRWQRARYEKRVQALEGQFHDADEKAKKAEARANDLEYEINVRKAELHDLQARADATDAALKTARQKTVTLKEAYETIRYIPMSDTPVSVADACAELAGLGYSCR